MWAMPVETFLRTFFFCLGPLPAAGGVLGVLVVVMGGLAMVSRARSCLGRRRGRRSSLDHSLAGAFARARVGVGSLPVDREPFSVAKTAVAPEIHQPLDVHLHVAPEIAFDLELGLDRLANGL